jgi:hypothetical protein
MPPLTDEQMAQRFAAEHPHVRWEPRKRPNKLSDAWFLHYAHEGRDEKLIQAFGLMHKFLAKTTATNPELAGTDVSVERGVRILKLALKYMKGK